MGLMQDAQKLIEQITTNTNEWALPVTFTTPVGFTPAASVVCNAVPINHNFAGVDDYAAPVKSQTARVTFSEAALVALNYPTRNATGVISMEKHLVSWIDVDGHLNNYIINTTFPGKTNGIIVCQLGVNIP
jgi:hypothetical protein